MTSITTWVINWQFNILKNNLHVKEYIYRGFNKSFDNQILSQKRVNAHKTLPSPQIFW